RERDDRDHGDEGGQDGTERHREHVVTLAGPQVRVRP
ncbi:MAG: hypothetical protein JWN84_1713, partial [Nocardioides sp.]|nr:hypothetical protein [Nocardioides sp.]